MLIWTNFPGHRSEPGKCVIMHPKPLANLKSAYVKWIKKLQAPFLRYLCLMARTETRAGRYLCLRFLP